MAPDRHKEEHETDGDEVAEGIDPGVRLMYLANGGDVEGIGEVLDSGVNVNFKDIDGRTALHVAACQGLADVVSLLLDRGAEVDVKDNWGSTVRALLLVPILSFPFSSQRIWNLILVLTKQPLADAIYYKNHESIKLLEKHGAKPLVRICVISFRFGSLIN